MLNITIPAIELYDNRTNLFSKTKEQTLSLEHSLVSVSKWEAKWHKPFISDKQKTTEELIDYVRCMTITQNVDPNIYNFLTQENMKQVNDYIKNSMTATWFSENPNTPKKPVNRQTITSELIYYWMVSLEIPFEAQKWHLNRLFTLIRIANIKNNPKGKKKMPRSDLNARNRALNASRRQKNNTSG